MENTIQSAEEFTRRQDSMNLDIHETMVKYASACSAPSSIGDGEIEAAAKTHAGSKWVENHSPVLYRERKHGFIKGCDFAISRLSERKIVLPSEINGFDYCSLSECVNSFESGYDLAISEIKRLNGIN